MAPPPDTVEVHLRGINRETWIRLRTAAITRRIPLVALVNDVLGDWVARQEKEEQQPR